MYLKVHQPLRRQIVLVFRKELEPEWVELPKYLGGVSVPSQTAVPGESDQKAGEAKQNLREVQKAKSEK